MNTTLRRGPWAACAAFSIGQLLVGSAGAADKDRIAPPAAKPAPPASVAPAAPAAKSAPAPVAPAPPAAKPAPAQATPNGPKASLPNNNNASHQAPGEVNRRAADAPPAANVKMPGVDRTDRTQSETNATPQRRDADDSHSPAARGETKPARPTTARSGSYDPQGKNSQRDRDGRHDKDNVGAVQHQVNRPIQSDRNSDRRDNNARTNGTAGLNTRSQLNTQGNVGRLGMNLGAGIGGAMIISSILPNSGFANVGFQPNDQIVSVGGQQFGSQAQMYNYLTTVQPGQRIPFIVSRGGQQQTLYWTPDEQFVQQFAADDSAGEQVDFLGIHLDEQVHDAAIVAQVEPNSPADQAGVRPDDMIVAVGGQQVSSPAQFADSIAKLPAGAPVELSVSRTMSLQIDPSAASRQSQAPVNVPARGPVAQPGLDPAPTPQPALAPAPQPVQQPAPQPVRRGLLPGIRGR